MRGRSISFTMYPFNTKRMFCVTVLLTVLSLLGVTEATSNTTQFTDQSCTVLQGPPGKDGRDGLNGRDGRDGLPGQCGISVAEMDKLKEQLRLEILQNVKLSIDPQYMRRCLQLGQQHTHPAASCQEIYSCNKNAPSGLYWIRAAHNNGIDYRKVYCDMENTYSGVRGWTRVAFFNMSNSSHACPHPLRQVTAGGKRLCTRSVDNTYSSVTFDNYGISYTRVCGRAIAYQFGHINGFYSSKFYGTSINGPYIDGISITHGSPRKHVWSLVVGNGKTVKNANEAVHVCPCSSKDAPQPPSFVGSDHYCDSGSDSVGGTTATYYMASPLWSGQGCPLGSSCCSSSGMPWFCKTLPRPTNDKIEVRWCSEEPIANEATPTELLELYIN